MESTNCALIFHDYMVKTIVFKQNKELLQKFEKEKREILIAPKIKRNITCHENNQYSIELSFELSEDVEIPSPIEIFIEIEGQFSVKEDNKSFIYDNATAILFPYLRALISTITANANLPSLIIPPINIVEIFKHQEIKDKNSRL